MKIKKQFTIFFIFIGFLFFAVFVFAASGYAWSDKIGWINFSTVSGNFSVTNSAVTGYAWSENSGWINLAPSKGGVKNDGAGNLSGYAWSEGAGWINFTGVKINCSGKFTGKASGDLAGTINFDCDSCDVRTEWKPELNCISSHNECNRENQCVSVNGFGSDSCKTSADCGAILEEPKEDISVEKIIEGVKELIKNIAKNAKTVALEVKKAVNTPIGSAVTKIISTTGAVTVTAVTSTAIFLAPSFSFYDFIITLIRIWGILLTFLGLRKKSKPWGVVYDSETKRPLDPAYVTLKDLKGKDVASNITDIDGRYGFLAEPGTYNIVVRKTNYGFPSKKLAGKANDEIYNNLYFGEQMQIQKTGDVIAKNIPMDPVRFDWNEFAKKNKTFMKFYSKWDIIIRKFSDWFFVIGFAVAISAYVFAPYPYNTIILLFYFILLLLRLTGLKPAYSGYVIEKSTGLPLSFAVIRVVSPGTNFEVSHKIADAYGRYYCLVPKGRYLVKIEKKNNDGSYSLVHASETIDASKKGIINKKFQI